ncbi:repetin-like isoform X3 [Bombus flavifrons]|uniref:repetin-like isoform X3 n=1 Tax=Bombus flavifrons TaxID=103934 RepID=UPI003703711C
MVAQSIVILSLLITYALSAPTGCIESCISYVKQYQTQTSGGLSQTASHLQGLDYSKPGTWSEHNDYDIDNGHGKVHEERGQYVTGPKTVRYYRKNSSSSYSTGYPNGEILSDFEYQNNRHGIHLPNTQEVFNSHNTYNQMGNSESVAQHKYNKIQSQQHTRSSYTKGERLEDLGEYSGRSQVIPQSTSNLNTQILQEPYHFNGQHGNWSTVDSYKTDGGRGHVFEEEGQYVSGPQKVRYYKRNYTSSYSSSDGIPIPKITKIGMHDIHQKLEKIEKEIGQEFKHISTAEAVGSTNIGQAHIRSHDLSIDNMHNINNNNYRRQHNHRNSLPMTHNEEQHSSDIRNEHLPYRNPYQNTYGANSYSTYERHEEYAQKLQPTSQLINPTSGYTSVLNTGNSGYNRNIYSGSTSQQQTDNYQQAEILDAHQSRQIAQTQTFLDNLRNNAQSQSSRIQSGMQGVSHYKEHWNASHTKEVSIPQHTTDISHMNQHSLQYNNNQYDNRHNLHQGIQQQDSYLHQFKEDGFTHGKKMLDKLISGVDTVDCDYNSQYTQSTSQYSRKYKRHAKYGKQDEVQQTQNKYINDDLTQQTSRKLEFGPDSQQSYQPWKPQGADQQLEDFTQKTGESDDLTQQTSGKLEFGQDSQQSYQPWKPQGADQQLRDFTQKTGESDDLTQQTSGKLEFGQDSQQSYQPWKSQGADQQLGDFTQKTGESDDLTQQTSRKLEFGQDLQQSYQPWKRYSGADQQLGDFTQKTGESDDFTQQTSGKLEFGQDLQQSFEPWKSQGADQQLGDFTQKTGESDDFTQQTSGKLEFGQDSQQPFEPWKPQGADQQLGDFAQKTGESDEFTQQTSGKLEFGQDSQQSYQPWKPQGADQQLEDFTQKTGESDDFTQQTSGKLEFDQDSQQYFQPWKPESASQQLGDFTQKRGESDDLIQQSSGKVEFGQNSQQSHQSWKPQSASQQLEDFTQETEKFDDFTQQNSGKLEIGQDSQQSYQPWKPQGADQQLGDFTQKTGESDDFTQQTSGKLEFGQDSQQSFEPWKPQGADQQLGDFTQKTGESDDFTQQTSGKLEFGQDSQQSFEPWKPQGADQQLGDFAQKTGESDDFTQQTSGKLEFGQDLQQSYQPWKPQGADQQLGDFTQKTGESDDFTQHTSGKLEFGQDSQQSYQPWKPQGADQQLGDFTHKTGEFDDFTQQTSGNLEFGQESEQSFPTWHPNVRDQKWGHLTQQTSSQPKDDLQKPAEKPKPRSRYSRRWSTVNTQVLNQDMYNINNQNNLNLNAGDTDAPNIYELPPQVNVEGDKDNIRRQSTRGDQGQDKDVSKKLSQQAGSSGYDVEGGNVDQVNWLHKSNDATVGLQWHYTYHPSDQRQFVQQTDQKNKEDLQQRSIQTQFSNLQQNPKQEEQIKYIVDNSDQQESHWQPQNYATEQGIKSVRKPFRYIQHENKLMSDQQKRENENLQKYVETASSEPKLQPRILEVYGGGQYDPTHSGDIYSGVTINPSATLPPTSNTDPWDIREKPEIMVTTTELTMPPLPVEPLNTNDTNEPPRPSSLWTRIGHKITTTFDKAKEKARNIFG